MSDTITTNNKFHLGVYGVIIKNSYILLVKKSRGPYTGKLDLPGGKPEHGESPEQVLAREVAEESGVIVHQVQLLNNYSTLAEHRIDRTTHEVIHHFGMIYKILSFDDKSLIKEMNSHDSLGAQWYQITQLKEDQLSPFALRVIQSLNVF